MFWPFFHLRFGNCILVSEILSLFLFFLKYFFLTLLLARVINSGWMKLTAVVFPSSNFPQIYPPFPYSQVIRLAALHIWAINSGFSSLKKKSFLSYQTGFALFFVPPVLLFTSLYLTVITFPLYFYSNMYFPLKSELLEIKNVNFQVCLLFAHTLAYSSSRQILNDHYEWMDKCSTLFQPTDRCLWFFLLLIFN